MTTTVDHDIVMIDSDLLRGAPGIDPVEAALATIGAVVVRTATSYTLARVVVQRAQTPGVILNVYGADGIPEVDLTVAQIRTDGRGEIAKTDSAGHVAFNWGAASAFTQPGAGPIAIGLVESASRDEDSKYVVTGPLLSDQVRSLGDYQGEHIQVYLQFVERGAQRPPPAERPNLKAVILHLVEIHDALDKLIAALEVL